MIDLRRQCSSGIPASESGGEPVKEVARLEETEDFADTRKIPTAVGRGRVLPHSTLTRSSRPPLFVFRLHIHL